MLLLPLLLLLPLSQTVDARSSTLMESHYNWHWCHLCIRHQTSQSSKDRVLAPTLINKVECLQSKLPPFAPYQLKPHTSVPMGGAQIYLYYSYKGNRLNFVHCMKGRHHNVGLYSTYKGFSKDDTYPQMLKKKIYYIFITCKKYL